MYLLNCLKCFIFLIAAFSLNIYAATNNAIQISPPNWWVGMQSNHLQLMLHGDNLENATVKFNNKAIKLLAIHQPDNSNYLFVDLEIDAKLKADKYTLSFFQKGKKIADLSYLFKQRRAHSRERKGFSPQDSIYLITLDRFANGEKVNDQVESFADKADRDNPDARHGGDIQGLIEHLKYVSDLGFTQIWLNPLVENNNPQYSYHGYGITDFYKIDPRFGTNKLYFNLSKDARRKGIGLIMDSVLNHISINHPWMRDLPSSDWINHYDGYRLTNHNRATQQDPHVSEKDRRAFTDGWFVPEMPDLNQRNSFLANYLIQNNIWWIESADLSGLRIDTYSYSDKDFLTEFSKRIMAEYPNFNMVGEEWSTKPSQVAYWQKGKMNQDGYQSYLPSLMDFPLQQQLINALKQNITTNGFSSVYQLLAEDGLYPNPDSLVVFADNHDMDRLYTQVGKSLKLTKLALIFIATTRGIPQIYYGTEVLLSNKQRHNHASIRTDFPGGWRDDQVNAFTGRGLSDKQKEMQHFVKGLFNWRKNSPVMKSSKLIQHFPQKWVYLYLRYNSKGKVMVVLNQSDRTYILEPKSYISMAEINENNVSAVEILSAREVDLNKAISVGSMQGMIIELLDKP